MTDPRFIHLRLHTEYSVVDGLVRVDVAIKRAKDVAMLVWDMGVAMRTMRLHTHQNHYGAGAGKPTYTFLGDEPTIVRRGGSAEFGPLNAYTRDYTFAADYRYYGVRSSLISVNARDADPEIDAVVGNPGPINRVPEPGTLGLLGLAFLALATRHRLR